MAATKATPSGAAGSPDASIAATGATCVIRRLGLDDVAASSALRVRGLRDHPAAFGSDYETESRVTPEEATRRFAERNTSDRSHVLGAFDPTTGALIGTVGIGQERGGKLRHKALIWGMYVASEARGRGVGRALIDAAIALARTWPEVELIHLAVAADNPPAQALYRAAGFVTWGLEPRAIKLPDRYVDEEHMVLTL